MTVVAGEPRNIFSIETRGDECKKETANVLRSTGCLNFCLGLTMTLTITLILKFIFT